jgi:hypothetical protein
LVAGCAPQPDVTAKDSDNGRQIQLHSGQLFDIVLADDYKTSKCQWRDNQHYDTTILDKLGYCYEADRSPPGHNGEGTFTFRYRAKRAGTVHLALEESDNGYPAHVCRQFTLDVTVR